ncbi:hypothetical protein NBRC116594_15690 [Shimia sp. NS0008-38b]|uniref:hypothetical protein n=1 Tax=Shimia sp. NS0008-38b TaxID=3127653 RepID=UPI003104A0E3
MSKPKLTLVHDSASNPNVSQFREQWGFENAKQLKLFDESDRDRLFVVPMNEMDGFRFSKLIEGEMPTSIIDTRKYPDFFGLFRSTRAALDQFRKSQIDYVHAPVRWTAIQEAADSWTVRSSLIDGLSRAKGASDFHGRAVLLLISTDEMKEACSAIFASLPDFEQQWQLQAL